MEIAAASSVYSAKPSTLNEIRRRKYSTSLSRQLTPAKIRYARSAGTPGRTASNTTNTRPW